MKHAIPYLIFSGNCREALQFYADCLNGEITSLTTVKDAPFDVPPGMETRIFDSEFSAENVRFKASDDMPGYEVSTGSNFAIFVTFSDSDERRSAFEKLAAGGQIQFPLEGNFGMVVDKYNIQWMLAAQR